MKMHFSLIFELFAAEEIKMKPRQTDQCDQNGQFIGLWAAF